MIKQLLQYKWSNKVTTAPQESHSAVAQLDDTGVGSGTFLTLKGAFGKTTTTAFLQTLMGHLFYIIPKHKVSESQ
jgi:hypothetical protein